MIALWQPVQDQLRVSLAPETDGTKFEELDAPAADVNRGSWLPTSRETTATNATVKTSPLGDTRRDALCRPFSPISNPCGADRRTRPPRPRFGANEVRYLALSSSTLVYTWPHRGPFIRHAHGRGRMARVFVTKIHQSRESSPSLRTTIPESVATVLNVQRGDSLVWTVEPEARRVTVAQRTPSTPSFGR